MEFIFLFLLNNKILLKCVFEVNERGGGENQKKKKIVYFLFIIKNLQSFN
jgi:hypothetical protein